MKPNEVVTKVRELCAASKEAETAIKAGWNVVCDKIEKRALAKRPKPKVFEVHHETEVARLAYLKAIAEGKTPDAAQVVGANAVGLE